MRVNRGTLPGLHLGLAACLFAAAALLAPRFCLAAEEPYVVLVSVDGLGSGVPARFGADQLQALGARGLQAEGLVPVYPTLTFPNHYSIATGRLPRHHGLVANRFPSGDRSAWYSLRDRAAVEDGQWYLAEPIWVTAERHGMPTAAFYFVGTEADVGGVRPARWRSFDPDVPDRKRVDQVLSWLAEPPETRPRLTTLYFETVDDAGHYHGPGSTEHRAAVAAVDADLGRLVAGIRALPHGDRVSLIVVSDHGSAPYRADRQPRVLDRHADLSGIRVVEGGSYAFLYFEQDAGRRYAVRDAINLGWDCGRALLPGEMPAAWHWPSGGRFPDLVVQPDLGCAVVSSTERLARLTPGTHGWPPESREMWGVLYAAGPRIPPGTLTGPVSVLDVHPLLLELLGLPAPGPTDGDPNRLAGLLRTAGGAADPPRTFVRE